MARGFRGYKTARGAAGRLKAAGYADIGAMAEATLSAQRAPSVATPWARRGDVGLAQVDERMGLLVRGAQGLWWGPGLDHMVYVETVNRAWAVGWPGRE
jgi:hypothetical protein